MAVWWALLLLLWPYPAIQPCPTLCTCTSAQAKDEPSYVVNKKKSLRGWLIEEKGCCVEGDWLTGVISGVWGGGGMPRFSHSRSPVGRCCSVWGVIERT
uniref:Secreted protein n=1 Tax=Knipowitschia caucasica TaxID=637954 RepID=A0AAV2JI41_KNICA